MIHQWHFELTQRRVHQAAVVTQITGQLLAASPPPPGGRRSPRPLIRGSRNGSGASVPGSSFVDGRGVSCTRGRTKFRRSLNPKWSALIVIIHASLLARWHWVSSLACYKDG